MLRLTYKGDSCLALAIIALILNYQKLQIRKTQWLEQVEPQMWYTYAPRANCEFLMLGNGRWGVVSDWGCQRQIVVPARRQNPRQRELGMRSAKRLPLGDGSTTGDLIEAQ